MTGTYRTKLVSVRDGDEGFVHLSSARNIGRHGKKANRRQQRRDSVKQREASLREYETNRTDAFGRDWGLSDFDRSAMAHATPIDGPILSYSWESWNDLCDILDIDDFGESFDFYGYDDDDCPEDDGDFFLDHGWDEIARAGSVYDFLYAGDTKADSDGEDE